MTSIPRLNSANLRKVSNNRYVQHESQTSLALLSTHVISYEQLSCSACSYSWGKLSTRTTPIKNYVWIGNLYTCSRRVDGNNVFCEWLLVAYKVYWRSNTNYPLTLMADIRPNYGKQKFDKLLIKYSLPEDCSCVTTFNAGEYMTHIAAAVQDVSASAACPVVVMILCV